MSTIRKHGHNWQAIVRLKDGYPPSYKCFPTKQEAKDWASREEARRRQETYFPEQVAKKHTLARAIDQYVELILPSKPKGARDILRHLNWWKEKLGNYALACVTPEVIAQCRKELMEGITSKGTKRSSATVNRYMAALSIVFTYAVKECGWISINPMLRVSKLRESRGRDRVLGKDECDRLLASCAKSRNTLLLPIVILAITTGMRQGEILNLTWNDVDLDQGIISLKETKNGRPRSVPVVEAASDLFNEADSLPFERPEADRFFNYPYTALEEALANAVYHRDYAIREPIEVSIHPDRIEILSFPGPMPPLKIDDINKGHIRVRSYRNRRVGDFLKELHLTEGRCTGIPKIKKSMDVNGSPLPIFQTDKEELSFLTVLPVHPQATQNIGRKTLKHTEEKSETHRLPGVFPFQTHRLPGVFPFQTHRLPGVFEMDTLPENLKDILAKLSKRPSPEALRRTIKALCLWKPLTAQDLAVILYRKDKKHLVRTYLTPMVNAGELKYVYPNEPDFPKQAYTGA